MLTQVNYSTLDGTQVLEEQHVGSCMEQMMCNVSATPRLVVQLLTIAFAICLIGIVSIKFGESTSGQCTCIYNKAFFERNYVSCCDLPPYCAVDIITSAATPRVTSGTGNKVLTNPHNAAANVTELVLQGRRTKQNRKFDQVVEQALNPHRN